MILMLLYLFQHQSSKQVLSVSKEVMEMGYPNWGISLCFLPINESNNRKAVLFRNQLQGTIQQSPILVVGYFLVSR